MKDFTICESDELIELHAEVERLQAELYEAYIRTRKQRDRLREALETLIVGGCAGAVPHDGERRVLQDAVDIARAALAEQEVGDEL